MSEVDQFPRRVPPGQPVRILTGAGLIARVRDAIIGDLDGMRAVLLAHMGNTVTVTQNSDGTWPVITRREWLVYRWRSIDGHHETLPTSEHGAEAGDEYPALASAFLPGAVLTTPETRTATFIEDFSGVADGDPWPSSRWVPHPAPDGGGAAVRGERGRLTTGNRGDYNYLDGAGVSVSGARGDVEVLFSWAFVAGGQELRVPVRATLEGLPGEPLSLRGGLMIGLRDGTIRIVQANEWAYTTLATGGGSLPDSGWCRVVVRNLDTDRVLVRARVWPMTGTEPSGWTVETVASGAPRQGLVAFIAPAGQVAGTRSVVDIDAVRLFDRAPATNPEWWQQ